MAAETDYADLREAIGAEVPDDLLRLAMTHRSYAFEQGGLPSNERLEFLGDSVLGLVVTDHLYRGYPDLPEGKLAKIRAAVVNARACAEVARTIGVGPYLLLGRGEESTHGRKKTSILADAAEAVIGAVYLGCGREEATAVIGRLFFPLITVAADLGAGLDWKTSLQELTARLGLGVPRYAVVDSGPDHAKEFVARVKLPSGEFGEGTGRTKKEAEMLAAESAYHELQALHPRDSA